MELVEVAHVGLWGFLVSLVCSVVVVKTTRWHGKFTLDGTAGVQKHHSTPIPRVGGVAIFAGLLALYAAAPGAIAELLGPVIVAGLPAFAFGVGEDLTKCVSVRARLLATMTSGLLAWLMTGTAITHTHVIGLDAALAWLPFSVLFTAFAVGGVANAVNIIDGFNGLASGTVAICIFTLGVIAGHAGDPLLATLCFAICAVVAGFWVVNFPLGKLFLGDGGAYMLGFIMAWLAIMLPTRNPSVSVWASFLACGYPIFETVFTIGRRMWARSHPGEPDSGHLHSLVKVAVANRLFAGLRPPFTNALVSPFCWAIAALAAWLAVRYSAHTGLLVAATLTSFLVYVAFYCWARKVALQYRPQQARPPLTVVSSKRPDSFATLNADAGDEEVARVRAG